MWIYLTPLRVFELKVVCTIIIFLNLLVYFSSWICSLLCNIYEQRNSFYFLQRLAIFLGIASDGMHFTYLNNSEQLKMTFRILMLFPLLVKIFV